MNLFIGRELYLTVKRSKELMDFAEVIIDKEDDHINLDAPLPAKQIYLKRGDAAEVIVV